MMPNILMKTKNIIDQPFSQWTENELILHFKLLQQKKHPLLTEWLAATSELSEMEQYYLAFLQHHAEPYIHGWQEAELRDNFIAPIVNFANFNVPEYFFSAFSERSITVNWKNVTLKGKIEWMVAMGKSHPQQPFFFIHEYKPEKGNQSDPLVQLLVTMLCAQKQNQEPLADVLKPYVKVDITTMPIYGCYILGKHWHFVILDKQSYCVSSAYDAMVWEELVQIFYILRYQKEWIKSCLRKIRG